MCLGFKMGFPDLKVIFRPQKRSKLSQNAKNTQKTPLSALNADLIAVKLATKHSISIKWSHIRFCGLKMWFTDHNVAPRSQKWPDLAKKCQTLSKNLTFCSDGRVPFPLKGSPVIQKTSFQALDIPCAGSQIGPFGITFTSLRLDHARSGRTEGCVSLGLRFTSYLMFRDTETEKFVCTSLVSS